MMTTNKKLIKEIKSMIDSSTKAINLAKVELEKIDAKYRALAEKEKSELNDTVKFFETQVAKYQSMVAEPAVEAEETPTEEPIMDTIFPENNESAEAPATLEAPAEEVSVPQDLFEASSSSTTDEDMPEDEPANPAGTSGEEWTEATDTTDTPNAVANEDEWPEMPEEWK